MPATYGVNVGEVYAPLPVDRGGEHGVHGAVVSFGPYDSDHVIVPVGLTPPANVAVSVSLVADPATRRARARW